LLANHQFTFIRYWTMQISWYVADIMNINELGLLTGQEPETSP